MCDERHIETIEGLYKHLKGYIDLGYGDSKIRCFDGYLYNDAYSFNPKERVYEIRGYYSDTDLGNKTAKLINDIGKATLKYQESLQKAYAQRGKEVDNGLTDN